MGKIADKKTKKGITLIALVITIVVLIILAAVAINLSLGNNGIFNRAKTAKEQYTNEQNYEQKEIGRATSKIDSLVDGNRGDVTLTQEEYEKFKRQGYTLLYEGNANSKKSYSFLEGTGDVKDYDFIVITFIQSPHGYGMSSYYINSRDITKDKLNDIILNGYYDRYCYMHFTNKGFVVDELKGESSTFVYPYRIYGVNV